MKWADHLYVSESVAEKREIIIRKANRNVGLVHVYFVALASNGSDLFDIFDGAYLKQPSFYKQDLKIIGIAENKAEAIDLTVQIVKDMYEMTGDFQVQEYFTFTGKDSRDNKRKRRGLCGMQFFWS